MNIAIVSIRSLDGFGGMETVISTVVRELVACGDNVNLILRHSKKADMAWTAGLPCHVIRVGGNWINKVTYCYKLTRLLNCLQPDVVLAVQPNAISYLKYYRYLHKQVRIGSWLHFALSAFKAHRLRHLDQYDFHLAISSGIADAIRQRVKNQNVYLVYNPTYPSGQVIKRPQIPTFVYMGRLIFDGQKRVNDLLTALAHLQGEWKAIIIGDGSDADKLKQLAHDLRIADKIEWLGWQRHPWETIKEASALVLCSDYEGFGMVLVEALNRGLPCISSDCPAGPSDIIIPGHNGWLYPLRDITRLTEILQMIVDNPVTSLPDQQTIQQSANRFSTKNIIPIIRTALLNEIRGQ